MYRVVISYESGSFKVVEFATVDAANAFVKGIGEGVSNHDEFMSAEVQTDNTNTATRYTATGPFWCSDASIEDFVKALDEIASIVNEVAEPVDEAYWQEIRELLPEDA